ncbi:MAG: iron-containing alcohol dehydrogenase family protein [Eubacteriales bacterium]
MKSKTQRIAIPEMLEVGSDNLSKIGKYLVKVGVSKFVLFFGEGINDMFGETVFQAFKEYKELEILANYECENNSMEDIMKRAFSLPPKAEAIIGIGGGKILDVAKYTAFLNNLPFISIPTSTAHDGFSSSGCSLYVQGKRTSVQAFMPYGIIVDTSVVKQSPERFIYSGIGDIVSKITAIYDWMYEEKNGFARVNDFAVMIAKKSVNSIVRMPYSSIKEEFFIKELVDSLTMSGIAMEVAGSSAPASGSEHLISHALDQITTSPQLHGIQVGLATYIMSKVQKHRYERVEKFLTDTGFFSFVKSLKLNASDFEEAIDIAPSIKPNRKTYIHYSKHRNGAKKILYTDKILTTILQR